MGTIRAIHIDLSEQVATKLGEAGQKIVGLDIGGSVLPGVFGRVEVVQIDRRLPRHLTSVGIACDVIQVDATILYLRFPLDVREFDRTVDQGVNRHGTGAVNIRKQQ